MSMTVTEAKIELRRAYIIDRQIDSKMLEAMRLRSIAEKATATLSRDGAMMVRTGKGGFENAVLELDQLENEIISDIETLIRAKRGIAAVVKSVGGKDGVLLHYRYMSFLSFEEIAVKMSYTWRHTLRLHGEALKKAAEVMEKSGQVAS